MVAAGVLGIIEFLGGGGIDAGGGALCLSGAGCLASAPAIVAGDALIAYGSLVTLAGATNFGKDLTTLFSKTEDGQDKEPTELSSGATRAQQYSANWPKANLNEAIKKFAGRDPIITTTDKGKRIYTNSQTGIQVVEDTTGNYFRIYDPSLPGKRAYLDLDGKVPNNKILDNEKQIGRNQSEYNEVTHFNIDRNS